MQFRKKPVVIEARLFDGTPESARDIAIWAHEGMDPAANAIVTAAYTQINPMRVALSIRTLEGTMMALPNDWIIKGVKGEFYPCKPDIFEATYEAVD